MKRRTFLKMTAMGSVAFAAGCSPDPDRKLFSPVHAPENMVTGQPLWFASTCRECPAGCGLIAKNREGRVIKLEGNPLHPVNRGKLCIRGQAGLQGVYDPDRVRRPMLKEKGGWREISFAEAEKVLAARTAAAAEKGPGRVRFLSDVMGDPLEALVRQATSAWRSPGPVMFEPFAYESQKTANAAVFGIEGLFGYRLEEADMLVGFGADFLETWLSPVEYARRFTDMHRFREGRGGLFFQVSPFQSLTGANADAWLGCRPGGEAVVAMGLLGLALAADRGQGLPKKTRDRLKTLTDRYPREHVLDRSGVAADGYDRMAERLLQARRPLVLGSGAAAAGMNSLQTEVAVNLLNRALDPDLSLLDFSRRYRVERAARRSEVLELFRAVAEGGVDVLLVHNANPAYALPAACGVEALLDGPDTFVAALSPFLDETCAHADLILPVRLPLETWDAYAGTQDVLGLQQPTLGRLTDAPGIGDLLLKTAFGDAPPAADYRTFLAGYLQKRYRMTTEGDRLRAFQTGGRFSEEAPKAASAKPAAIDMERVAAAVEELKAPGGGPVFVAAPSIRYLDGRGANRPWLSEIPDSLTQVAWQSTVMLHPETAAALSAPQGRVLRLQNGDARVEAPAYVWEGVVPGVLVMAAGLGHTEYGRFARGRGDNPYRILPAAAGAADGGSASAVEGIGIHRTPDTRALAHIDGSRVQHDRKIALSVSPAALGGAKPPPKAGLTMWDFPLTLPLPEGYDPKRDFYPPHAHEGYRWAMVVDLDRCIGCNACAAACYAENNLAVVGEERMIEGREMAWLQIQRYLDPETGGRVIFLPMMCQHCDNAPCESVCPVYAPHHSKEGLNNQIYNRCIGTRFCSQNCPYKLRRFNWFAYRWPSPLDLQLNPDVTVRTKGVMEKCSFCIQRIKAAHNTAKNEKRPIRDGEMVTACMQTCPTGAISFGSLMDPESRVRRLVDDPRAYQVMGYLNTKPAVIYLKKVVQEV